MQFFKKKPDFREDYYMAQFGPMYEFDNMRGEGVSFFFVKDKRSLEYFIIVANKRNLIKDTKRTTMEILKIGNQSNFCLEFIGINQNVKCKKRGIEGGVLQIILNCENRGKSYFVMLKTKVLFEMFFLFSIMIKEGLAIPKLYFEGENKKAKLEIMKDNEINKFNFSKLNMEFGNDEKEIDNLTTFYDIWVKLIDYNCNLLKDLYISNLDINSNYNIEVLMKSQCVAKDIEIEQRNIYKKSENIEINDFSVLIKDKKRIYFGDIDEKQYSKIIPYLIGMYENGKEKEIDENNKQLYKQLLERVELIKSTNQLENNLRMKNQFRVINDDIERTNGNIYKNVPKGKKLLQDILYSYCIYNPEIGYVQGMSDISVSIIELYITEWDDNGPIYPEGIELDYVSKVFWCFVNFIKKLKHDLILKNIPNGNKLIAKKTRKLLKLTVPSIYYWMKFNYEQLNNMFWLLSSSVMLFKREFSNNIWKVWIGILSSKNPEEYLPYICAAGMIEVIPLISFDHSQGLNNIIVMEYKKKSPMLDVDKILKLAYAIYDDTQKI